MMARPAAALDDEERRREGRSVAAFSAWLKAAVAERDESHGHAHFERVRALVLQLAASELTAPRRAALPWRRPEFLLEIAALAHDYADHKYVSPEARHEREAELRAALLSEAGADAAEADAAVLVAANVSYSKECRGLLQREALRAAGCELLRDLVSDADKLDALGHVGLERLRAYQRHKLARDRGSPPSDEDVEAAARAFCRGDLLQRAASIQTTRGRALAAEGVDVVRRYLEEG